jgi:hypothetical protein
MVQVALVASSLPVVGLALVETALVSTPSPYGSIGIDHEKQTCHDEHGGKHSLAVLGRESRRLSVPAYQILNGKVFD